MNYKYKKFCESTEKKDAPLAKMKWSSDRSGVDGGSKHFVFYPVVLAIQLKHYCQTSFPIRWPQH